MPRIWSRAHIRCRYAATLRRDRWHNGAHALDLEGRSELWPGQRARQGVFGDGESRPQVVSGRFVRRRPHPLSQGAGGNRYRGRLLRHRQRVRNRQWRVGDPDEGRPCESAGAEESGDFDRRVRTRRPGRPDLLRQALLSRAVVEVSEGLRAAGEGVAGDRPVGDRVVHPAQPHAHGGAEGHRTWRDDPADAAVARRGAQARLRLPRRRRADPRPGIEDGVVVDRLDGHRLRPGRVLRHLPGRTVEADRGESRRRRGISGER